MLEKIAAVPYNKGRQQITGISAVGSAPALGKSPKRHRGWKQRGDFEEVSRLATTKGGRESADTTVGVQSGRIRWSFLPNNESSK